MSQKTRDINVQSSLLPTSEHKRKKSYTIVRLTFLLEQSFTVSLLQNKLFPIQFYTQKMILQQKRVHSFQLENNTNDRQC